MRNAGLAQRVGMDEEGLKRPGRPVPVPEDYDGDDFEDDYFDSDQEEG